MFENSTSKGDLTLHIVLATVPQRQEATFINSVEHDYFEKYRVDSAQYCTVNDPSYLYSTKDEASEVPVLYNPLKYHLLGNYDIAYITLIDNLKFAQKLFEPKSKDPAAGGVDILAPYSFQSFTGMTNESPSYLRDFFYDALKEQQTVRKYYLGICNLKLNNAFLIGNGKSFFEAVSHQIETEISTYNKKVGKPNKKVDHLILQSFSWFEFSLLLFSDDSQSVAEITRALRGLCVGALKDAADLMSNSLYNELFPDVPPTELGKANVFADTHTYFGIHADLVESPADDPYLEEFLRKQTKVKFKTEIELQVKPGHMHLLVELLKKEQDRLPMNLDLKHRYMLMGKSDYLLLEKSDTIVTNLNLIRLTMAPDQPFYDHVRKIRTRVLFKTKHKDHEEKHRQSLHLYKVLQKLGKPIGKVRELDSRLKALKVSRQIRNKILKIFTNYNNGIQDIVLFSYFLDFKIFIDELELFIKTEFDNWFDPDKSRLLPGNTSGFNEKELITVSVLENRLMKRIEIFQEGYNVRMLNCYQFEDITDFDLDFNSSIQQLLTAYSTMIIEIGNTYYKDRYEYGPVVQLNLKDTISSYNSINYYIHHLISPEFVFATITKEILNNDQFDTKMVKQIQEKYTSVKDDLAKYNPHLLSMVEEDLIDLNYLFVDAIRFLISYDLDFKLFYFWFWTYNLQNPIIYDKSGLVNEAHFKKELFRSLFIAKLFNFSTDQLKCPLPEMQTYWERHFIKLSKYVDIYMTFLNDKGILKEFGKYLFQRYEKFLEMFSLNFEGEPKPTPTAREKVRQLKAIKALSNTTFNPDGLYIKEMRYDEYTARASSVGPQVDCLMHWHFYMHAYLKFICNQNHGEFSLLRRNWKTGEPLGSFIRANDKPHIYSVDQTGGLFFDDMKQLNLYNRVSSSVIKDILHYSLLAKKNFIVEQLKKSTITNA